MSCKMAVKRRQFLRYALVGMASAGVGGIFWATRRIDTRTLTVDEALATLDRMRGEELVSATDWSPSHVLGHCAQSVEYSMKGFPEMKSATFRSSVGAAVFGVFRAQGWMRHGLTEAIPGVPDVEPLATPLALARLRQAYLDFAAFKGPLAPHFAYGDLTHADYTIAHVMHLNNHLERLRSASVSP